MNVRLSLSTLAVSSALMFSSVSMAQSALLEGWSGSASLGANISDGNSDTRNINGSANITKQQGPWAHTAFGNLYNSENNDVEVANRFDLGYKLDRNIINDVTYVFGRIRFDVDDFGNIDQRLSGTVGIGRHFIQDERQTFSGEIGIGATQTDFLSLNPVQIVNTDPAAVDAAGFPIGVGESISDPSQTPIDSLEESGALLYGSLKYSNILSEILTFNSVLSVEVSDDNTYTLWDNSLGIKLSDRVSLALGLLTRNNSDIVGPLGENTDTVTSISIVYGI